MSESVCGIVFDYMEGGFGGYWKVTGNIRYVYNVDLVDV